jgi:ER-bound oxygenase mpaB/B'/Rubber oxygenase, catalytic domain
LKTPFNPSSITVDALQQFRFVTDPLADETIARIITAGEEKQINQVLMTLVRNDSFQKGMFVSFGSEIADLLDQYIQVSGALPDWADPELISKGEHLFELYGPNIFMLLNVSSLPMCYCCGHGAQVLYDTGRLLTNNGNVDPLARRLMETAQMVVNTLSKGGLSPNGAGVVTLQKVRLIHASIRYFLKRGQSIQTWDQQKLGEPINQEDLAGTLMSFGPVILSGLKRLGVSLSEEESTAWMHCWNITGKLLGIADELLPDTYAQGFQLATDILRHQAVPSDAGKALTDACIKFMNKVIPGNAFDDVPVYLMWYFLQDFSKSTGKDLAATIGVAEQENRRDKIVLAITHFVNAMLSKEDSHDRFVCKIVESFNRMLLQGMIYHFNGGKGVQFFIPPSLQSNWGMTETWKDHIATPAVMGNRLAWQKKSDVLKN